MSGVKNHLLTGATGFLGGYLLKELLERGEGKIYCLCRPGKGAPARERVLGNLSFLFGDGAFSQEAKERILVVEGDVGQDDFGLPAHEYAALCMGVSEIFHAAAMLWHFGKMEEFENVNVQSVRRLLDFAGSGAPKRLNHISTLAVSGRRCDNPDNFFREGHFHENMESPNVYVESKVKAESLLRPHLGHYPGHSPGEGAGVRIFRPGFLMGDSVTGRFKREITLDAQYLHLQGHILMRTAPPLHPDDYMDLTPVDYAAAAIVNIALQPDSAGAVYHICNPRPILKSDIWYFIRDYGYPVRVVAPENYLMEAFNRDDDLFVQGMQSVLVYLGDYEKSPAVFDSSLTLGRLEGSGISCPEPGRDLLRRYLDYCVNIGFIPAPEAIIDYEKTL